MSEEPTPRRFPDIMGKDPGPPHLFPEIMLEQWRKRLMAVMTERPWYLSPDAPWPPPPLPPPSLRDRFYWWRVRTVGDIRCRIARVVCAHDHDGYY